MSIRNVLRVVLAGGENRVRRTGEWRTDELGKPLTIRRSLGLEKQFGIYQNEQTFAENLGRWFHHPALPDAVTGSSASVLTD